MKSLLAPSDFAPLAPCKIPGNVPSGHPFGVLCRGLAVRPGTGRVFTVGLYPNDDQTFYLYELQVNPGGTATVVREWGDLNRDRRLITPAMRANRPWVCGLWWDDAAGVLWASGGRFYNGDPAALPLASLALVETPFTDLVVVTATTVSSATAGFSAAHVGGVVTVGGLGYHVLSVSAGVATLHRSIGTPGGPPLAGRVNVTAMTGPWGVTGDATAETVKGCVFPLPPEVQAAFPGRRFGQFGVTGSTHQSQSWGTGLVAVADPTGTDPSVPTPADRLIHFPTATACGPASRWGSVNAVGAFPRSATYRRILGNEEQPYVPSQDFDCPPPPAAPRAFTVVASDASTVTLDATAPATYDPGPNAAGVDNGPVPADGIFCGYTVSTAWETRAVVGYRASTRTVTVDRPWGSPPAPGSSVQISAGGLWQQCDGMNGCLWVDTGAKWGLVQFGTVGEGWVWYGTTSSHSSTPSLYFPAPKLCSDPSGAAKGNCAEVYTPTLWCTDPDAVVAQAKAVAAGSGPDLRVPPAWSARLADLGYAVAPKQPASVPDTLGAAWDAASGRLYSVQGAAASGGNAVINTVQVG